MTEQRLTLSSREFSLWRVKSFGVSQRKKIVKSLIPQEKKVNLSTYTFEKSKSS